MESESESEELQLLKKIQELEAGQAMLKQEMSRLQDKDEAKEKAQDKEKEKEQSTPRRIMGLSEKHWVRVLQCMGQSLHVLDLQGRIIYWNTSAQLLYGYSSSEALGCDAASLLVHPPHLSHCHRVITAGDSWAGKLPVVSKSGHQFLALSTHTPFCDHDASLLGVVCVSTDLTLFDDPPTPPAAAPDSKPRENRPIGIGRWSEAGSTPLQTAFASRLTNLATKVTKKV